METLREYVDSPYIALPVTDNQPAERPRGPLRSCTHRGFRPRHNHSKPRFCPERLDSARLYPAVDCTRGPGWGKVQQGGGHLFICHGHDRGLSPTTLCAYCRMLTFPHFLPIQIFTGAIPFSNDGSVTAMLAVVQGKRPPRPTHPACTEDLWALMQRCWSDLPSSRTKISEVALEILTLSLCQRLVGHTLNTHDRISLIATIFLDNDRIQMVEHVSGVDAQTLIDVIDEVRPRMILRSKDGLFDFCSNFHAR